MARQHDPRNIMRCRYRGVKYRAKHGRRSVTRACCYRRKTFRAFRSIPRNVGSRRAAQSIFMFSRVVPRAHYEHPTPRRHLQAIGAHALRRRDTLSHTSHTIAYAHVKRRRLDEVANHKSPLERLT